MIGVAVGVVKIVVAVAVDCVSAGVTGTGLLHAPTIVTNATISSRMPDAPYGFMAFASNSKSHASLALALDATVTWRWRQNGDKNMRLIDLDQKGMCLGRIITRSSANRDHPASIADWKSPALTPR